MLATSFAYRAVVRLGVLCLPAAARVSPKLRQGHQARAGLVDRFRRWAATSRDPTRQLVWFHAPSVGEGLQADAVIRRVRQRHPEWQIVYTFFSPSAENLARRMAADYADYLPYDLPADVDALLDGLQPHALIFTKLDVWPELATRAARRAAVGLIAGTVRPHSGRLRWPMHEVLEPGYRALALAAAVANEDARRLRRLGVPPDRLRVLGDPRFDSVMDLVRAVPQDDPLLRLGAGAHTMVAGSTWPGDEAVLLDAFARLYVHRPEARLILVPHEPTEPRLGEIEAAAARLGVPAPLRLSRRRADEHPPILLVDRVGVLATLYGTGAMAYVGGGFHHAGLHSVVEPAAWGIPVVFGPRWTESREASLLLEAGGAEALSELGATQAGTTLQELWEDWIRNDRRRIAQGTKARRLVEAGTGAADRLADLVEELVRRR